MTEGEQTHGISSTMTRGDAAPCPKAPTIPSQAIQREPRLRSRAVATKISPIMANAKTGQIPTESQR